MPDGSSAGSHVLVIGAAVNDVIGRAQSPLKTGTSNPAHLSFSQGGVARNVAVNLAHLGMEAVLITAVGDDPPGHQILDQAASAGVVVDHSLVVEDQPTGSYLAVLEHDGSLHLALDELAVMDSLTPDHLRACKALFRQACTVFLDANLSPASLRTAVSLASRFKVPVCADPTSYSLAGRLQPFLPRLWLITPNQAEAEFYCAEPIPVANRERAMEAARHLISHGVKIAIITLAEYGVSYATADSSGHVPAVMTEIVDPTGAGDAFTAALLFALQNDIPLDEAVQLGVSAATLTLRTPGSVVPGLSLEMLYDQLR